MGKVLHFGGPFLHNSTMALLGFLPLLSHVRRETPEAPGHRITRQAGCRSRQEGPQVSNKVFL